MKNRKILLISTVLILISICMILGFIRFSEIMAIQSPQTTIRISVLDINEDEIIIQSIVDIKNTNSFDISMKNFRIITKTPEGHIVLDVPLDDKVVPSHKEKSFTTVGNIKFDEVIPHELTTQIKGNIGIKSIKKSMCIDIKIINSIENIIDIDIPTITCKSQFEELTNDCINFSGIITINNHNKFKMQVDNISTVISDENGNIVGNINVSKYEIHNDSLIVYTDGSLLIKALNSEFININITGKCILKIAGAEKVIPLSTSIQLHTPNLDEFIPDDPIHIIIKPNNKISDRKVVSDIVITIVNPTKINFIIKDCVISTYLLQDDKTELISEQIVDTSAMKVGDTTTLKNHIELPSRSDREIKNPDWIYINIKGKITINGLDKYIPIEISGYQDMNPFT